MSIFEESRKWLMGWKKKMVLMPVLLLTFLISACDPDSTFMSKTEDKSFDNIAKGRKVLAVTNLSSLKADVSFTFPNRSAAANKTAAIQDRFSAEWKSGAVRKDMEAASRFNANPPLVRQASSRSAESPRYNTYAPGSSRTFHVTNKQGQFVTLTATLRKQGVYGNVWVDNSCFTTGAEAAGKITASRAETLANKFDQIYPRTTNLLGYERGGEPGGDGGIDGDTRIQILVYDIADEDVVGYFWGKDELTQADLDNPWNPPDIKKLKSNEAEIFYIDAVFTVSYPETVYSTLIHEFQHMINFNQKALRLGSASETWYDEMLAMLAEDVIAPLIGIEANTTGHPIKEWLPLFLGIYWYAGVNQWLSGEDAIFSYSIAYAFGAYLIRNYGGPALIKDMLDNDAVNQESITRALRKVNGNNQLSFDTALSRYFEALLYSTSGTGGVPAGKMSFDRSQTSTIDATTYTAEAFDIWAMEMNGELLKQFDELVPDYKKGPIIFPLLQRISSPGYSLNLQKIPEDIAGTWNVTLRISPSAAIINLKVESY